MAAILSKALLIASSVTGLNLDRCDHRCVDGTFALSVSDAEQGNCTERCYSRSKLQQSHILDDRPWKCGFCEPSAGNFRAEPKRKKVGSEVYSIPPVSPSNASRRAQETAPPTPAPNFNPEFGELQYWERYEFDFSGVTGPSDSFFVINSVNEGDQVTCQIFGNPEAVLYMRWERPATQFAFDCESEGGPIRECTLDYNANRIYLMAKDIEETRDDSHIECFPSFAQELKYEESYQFQSLRVNTVFFIDPPEGQDIYCRMERNDAGIFSDGTIFSMRRDAVPNNSEYDCSMVSQPDGKAECSVDYASRVYILAGPPHLSGPGSVTCFPSSASQITYGETVTRSIFRVFGLTFYVDPLEGDSVTCTISTWEGRLVIILRWNQAPVTEFGINYDAYVPGPNPGDTTEVTMEYRGRLYLRVEGRNSFEDLDLMCFPTNSVIEIEYSERRTMSLADTPAFFVLRPRLGVTTTCTLSPSDEDNGRFGDADLYMKYGSRPSTQSSDCRSDNDGSDERCTLGYNGRDVYVMVYPYDRFRRVDLVCTGRVGSAFSSPSPSLALTAYPTITGFPSHSRVPSQIPTTLPSLEPSFSGITELEDGESVTLSLMEAGETLDFYIDPSIGQTITCKTQGISGNVDLFMAWTQVPDLGSMTWDCASRSSSSYEHCPLTYNGRIFILLAATTVVTEVQLKCFSRPNPAGEFVEVMYDTPVRVATNTNANFFIDPEVGDTVSCSLNSVVGILDLFLRWEDRADDKLALRDCISINRPFIDQTCALPYNGRIYIQVATRNAGDENFPNASADLSCSPTQEKILQEIQYNENYSGRFLPFHEQQQYFFIDPLPNEFVTCSLNEQFGGTRFYARFNELPSEYSFDVLADSRSDKRIDIPYGGRIYIAMVLQSIGRGARYRLSCTSTEATEIAYGQIVTGTIPVQRKTYLPQYYFIEPSRGEHVGCYSAGLGSLYMKYNSLPSYSDESGYEGDCESIPEAMECSLPYNGRVYIMILSDLSRFTFSCFTATEMQYDVPVSLSPSNYPQSFYIDPDEGDHTVCFIKDNVLNVLLFMRWEDIALPFASDCGNLFDRVGDSSSVRQQEQCDLPYNGRIFVTMQQLSPESALTNRIFRQQFDFACTRLPELTVGESVSVSLEVGQTSFFIDPNEGRFLECTLTVSNGDADLYMDWNSLPLSSKRDRERDYACRSANRGSADETCFLSYNGRVYITLLAVDPFADAIISCVDPSPPCASDVLIAGRQISLNSLRLGETAIFHMDVSEGQEVVCNLEGDNGDVDLLMRWNECPSFVVSEDGLYNYDCLSSSHSSAEECRLEYQGNRVFVMVYAFLPTVSVSLLCT